MKHHVIGWIALLSLLMVTACDDVFEEDLSSRNVRLRTPADQGTFSSGNLDFWWDEVDGATSYRLEVVEGTFQDPRALALDTVLSRNTFSFFLNSGDYEWKIRASNQSSFTTSEAWHFSVDSTFNLDNERVVLVSPVDGECLNDTLLLISWLDIPQPGINYFVDIRKGDFDDQVDILRFETFENQILVAIPPSQEGALSFGVRAVNDFGATPYASQDFSLDLTSPAQAVLTAPASAASVDTGSVVFRWQASVDVGCSVTDSLLIFSDSTLSTLETATGITDGSAQAVVFLNQGDYWWLVQREDLAGNRSQASAIRVLYVEP